MVIDDVALAQILATADGGCLGCVVDLIYRVDQEVPGFIDMVEEIDEPTGCYWRWSEVVERVRDHKEEGVSPC